MRATLSIIAILLLAACARPEPLDEQSAVHDPFARCSGDDRRACMAQVEAREIAGSGGRVQRRGMRLTFRLGNGETTALVNDTSDGGSAKRYVYAGYLPSIRHHVVEVRYYEGGSVLLLHEQTGATTDVHGFPAVAPGGRRVATASMDLIAGYTPNHIRVWRVTDTHLELEWGLDGGTRWGASDPVWHGPHVVTFTRHTLPSPSAGPSEVIRTSMRLDLRNGGLTVQSQDP
ncbi:hypothetical protein [Longimicrobium sp.]|jgi:hypothetical protein|uniref:hypothetical protein n=1 Tax=Longimicrobium sp. TaxID=2029185 RepID=UPI002F94BA78